MSDNDNGPKLVDLPAKPDELAAAGEHLKRNFETMIKNHILIAKLRRAAFLAYKDEGFTDAQALELCCK